MTTLGVELIVRALQAEGVDTLFTLAGDHILPLIDHMADAGFRFHRHPARAGGCGNGQCLAPHHRLARRDHVHHTRPRQRHPGPDFASHLESPIVNIVGSAAQDRPGQGASQEIDHSERIGHMEFVGNELPSFALRRCV